ncbi:Hypothetical protein A7982_00466 [Minicystis rosea]|nr:Hypothetical protein A7982_00466 [Minicystis rosea]
MRARLRRGSLYEHNACHALITELHGRHVVRGVLGLSLLALLRRRLVAHRATSAFS